MFTLLLNVSLAVFSKYPDICKFDNVIRFQESGEENKIVLPKPSPQKHRSCALQVVIILTAIYI